MEILIFWKGILAPYSYKKQLQTVLLIELGLLLLAGFFAFSFWNIVCPTSFDRCMIDLEEGTPGLFFLLAGARPFVMTPMWLFFLWSGGGYGVWMGTLMCALAGIIGCTVVFLPSKYIGKKLVNPWLSSNLPQTLQFFRSQDWKVVLALRLIPFMPFDLLSFFFGVVDFRYKYVLLMTFIGILPEAFLFSQITDPESMDMMTTIVSISILCSTLLLPGLTIEFLLRRRGSSMWSRLKAMWREIKYEAHVNNDIVKRRSYEPNKIPVLLLYGFFSSRRSLTVMERMLSAHGYQVLSFNLGGLMGVFFTKGIIETAHFIDRKIKTQFERHQFSKIRIVAHSKGGLVALWWLLKLGGNRYCDKIIVMGTPFKGSHLTWLALVTPLGFLWRDVWQMRPGSMFLRYLHKSHIPENLEIHCFYSNSDQVARGRMGLFEPDHKTDVIKPVPMHRVAHFAFLYKREVVEKIGEIFGDPTSACELPREKDNNDT